MIESVKVHTLFNNVGGMGEIYEEKDILGEDGLCLLMLLLRKPKRAEGTLQHFVSFYDIFEVGPDIHS